MIWSLFMSMTGSSCMSVLRRFLTLWDDVISNGQTAQDHMRNVKIRVHLQLRDHRGHVHKCLRVHLGGLADRMHQRKLPRTKRTRNNTEREALSVKGLVCKWFDLLLAQFKGGYSCSKIMLESSSAPCVLSLLQSHKYANDIRSY